MDIIFRESFKKAVDISYPYSKFMRPRLRRKRYEIDVIKLSSHVSEFLSFNDCPDLHISSGQCVKWSYFLEGIVAKFLKMKAWVTLGQLWNGEQYIHNPSWEDCGRYLKSGIHFSDMDTGGLNFHSWITAQDGSVIDVSFLSTLAQSVGGKWLESNGKILVPSQEDFFTNHKYVPMIVGHKALDRVLKHSTIPFLAANIDGLYPQPVAILEPVG